VRGRVEASERRAEVEELERQLAKLAIAKKDAESAEKLAEVSCTGSGFRAGLGLGLGSGLGLESDKCRAWICFKSHRCELQLRSIHDVLHCQLTLLSSSDCRWLCMRHAVLLGVASAQAARSAQVRAVSEPPIKRSLCKSVFPGRNAATHALGIITARWDW